MSADVACYRHPERPACAVSVGLPLSDPMGKPIYLCADCHHAFALWLNDRYLTAPMGPDA